MCKPVISLVILALLTGCGQEPKSEAKASDPKDKVLYEAVKQPLDKAKSVEDTIQADKDKLDKAIESQEQSAQ